MGSVYNCLIELLDGGILRVLLDIVGEPLLEVYVGLSLRVAGEQLRNPQDSPDQVEGPFGLTIVLRLQVILVLLIDELNLFYEFVKLGNDDVGANDQEPIHEPQALLLDILVAVLEASDDGIHHIRLVEVILLSHVLQEYEGGLPDGSSVIHIVFEWAEVDLDDELFLDWGLQ